MHRASKCLWLAGIWWAALARGETPSLETLQRRLMERYGPAWVQGQEPERPPAASRPGVVATARLPMCFFFEQGIDPTLAMERVRALVAAYAGCSIALEPYSYTLKPGYPVDPDRVVAAARQACPLDKVFRVHGAIQITTLLPDLARKMCRDSDAKSCSTLCEPVSVSVVGADTPVSQSIHESMHSNCCGPACVEQGLGVERVGPGIELAAAVPINPNVVWVAPHSRPGGIGLEGCEALRKGASPNAISQWYRAQEREGLAPAQHIPVVDLTAPKNVFGQTAERNLTSEAPMEEKEKEGAQAALRATVKDGKQETAKTTPGAPSKGTSSDDILSLRRNSQVVGGSGRSAMPKVKPPKNLGELLQSEPRSSSRTRGTGLRKAGDPKRQQTSSGVGEINPYEGPGGD